MNTANPNLFSLLFNDTISKKSGMNNILADRSVSSKFETKFHLFKSFSLAFKKEDTDNIIAKIRRKCFASSIFTYLYIV